MIAWISVNLINLVLTLAVILVAGLCIYSLVRDKKAGKSSCGGSCASCGACKGCAGGSCGCAPQR